MLKSQRDILGDCGVRPVVIVYSVRKPGIVIEIAALSSWTRGEQASEVL